VNAVRATVAWIPASQGGRVAIPSGPTYSTVSRWPGFDDQSAWSVVLVLESGNPYSALVRFLVDAAPWERLVPGARFEIFEGSRKVADIRVDP